jgi:putative colanic acid biosynthesis UDP-glucose lipid carrier transferase
MRNNNLSNRLIKWMVIVFDFVLLWCILLITVDLFPNYERWDEEKNLVYWLLCTISLLLTEIRFGTIIHLRQVGAGDILKRTTIIVATYTLIAYILLRAIDFRTPVGWRFIAIGISLWVVLILVRFVERWILKALRSAGYNSRHITLVGNDVALQKLSDKLIKNPTHGYKICNHYEKAEEFVNENQNDNEKNRRNLGDELYLCVPRTERHVIEFASQLCDKRMIKFYYVPPANESFNMQSVFIDDIEVFASYVSPLEEPLNRLLKRVFDIVASVIALLFAALLFPVVAIGILVQSPGPLLFRQRRTGIDGKDFWCLKFRSMHVNADSDRKQATKDDPRKFPFGNFMRKTNIDELPQFWNVLRGDMSIVGPRPHMLAHTEQYSALIGKYMVRHFVKPGITGWAQVTGFRGETSELWQMEGRVERDIYYIQHWSIWLDLRIIWMTVKTFIKTDKNAY